MKMGRRFFRISLILMLYAGMLSGQDKMPNVVITPEHAVIEPGGGLQMEAHLFTADGQPVKQFDTYKWQVKPDSLATINADGYLQAGRKSGIIVIIFMARYGGMNYFGEAKIEIGRPLPPPVRVIVTPANAHVRPDSSKKFRVVAVSANNRNFDIEHIRWKVNPADLGKMSQDGVFQAGSHNGQGHVIAMVDIGGAVYRGAADVTVAPPATGSITGAVSDDLSGVALADAKVVVQRLGPIHWTRSARTDANGSYTVERLIPGLYVVKAKAENYLTEYYKNATHLAEAFPVQVAEDSASGPIDFQLSHGAVINGTVRADDSTTVLPGTLVAAIRKTTNTKKFAIADSNGNYSLNALPQGAYVVFANSRGYYPEYFEDAKNLVDAKLFDITPPDTTDGVDFYLATATALGGSVVAAEDGSPLPGATIHIFKKKMNMARWKFVRSTVTDRDGNYLVPLAAGTYFVHANAQGYQGEYFDDTRNAAAAAEITVVENQHTTNIDFELTALGSVSGQVVNAASEEPVVGATVVAFLEMNPQNRDMIAQHDRRWFKTRTDSTGAFIFEALPSGKYYFKAKANGYLSEFWREASTLGEAEGVLVEVGTENDGIRFTLSRGATIAGNVYDAGDSTGLAGAAVTIWATNGGSKNHVFTDRDGHFEMSGLEAGEYYAFASLKGYDGKFFDGVDERADATPIVVEAEQTVDGKNFYLPKFAHQLGTITGVVTEEADSLSDSEPAPIAGAFVIAIPTKPGPAHFDVTDPFGNYRITRLLPGKYVVFSWAPGHAGEFFENVQKWHEATRLAIEKNSALDGVNFALAETERGPYFIRGRIHSGEGRNKRAVANAIVFAIGSRGMVAGVTDENGNFSIDELPAGDYKLRVDGADIETSYLGGTDETNAQTLSLENGIALDIGEMAVTTASTAVGDADAAIPVEFELQQNYPNPFNPETTVKFTLAQQDRAVIQIYNVLGQQIKTLLDKKLDAGVHTVQWNGEDSFGNRVASGIYLLHLTSGQNAATIRMVLLK